MIKRHLFSYIQQRLHTGKAIVLLGPRQTGKTTLLQQLSAELGNTLVLNCDDRSIQSLLENMTIAKMEQVIGNHTCVFIDEAQRIKNIGLTLKLITDQFKSIQLLVSGSSALELANEINEPLTGRKWEYMLYPISWLELQDSIGYVAAQQQLENRLIYGMYPDVINQVGDEKNVLQQLASSYLYKDLLSYAGIRKPDLLDKLLRALAFQIGQEVSYNELAQLLEVDKKTVYQYINLLEKAFIVFRLEPLHRNLRNEISSTRKIYFYDTGIRNAIIANFQSIALRNDTGALWENFLIAERRKQLTYEQKHANSYFWRTKAQQEVDYVEEKDGGLSAVEFKWNTTKQIKLPKSFTNAYPDAVCKLINPENFEEFLRMD